jgi:hypothetical protein
MKQLPRLEIADPNATPPPIVNDEKSLDLPNTDRFPDRNPFDDIEIQLPPMI